MVSVEYSIIVSIYYKISVIHIKYTMKYIFLTVITKYHSNFTDRSRCV